MRLPPPDQFGDELAVVDILIDYDGPQLVQVAGRSGKAYLAIHTTPLRGQDRWLYAELSDSRMNDFLRGDLSPHSAFRAAEQDVLRVVSFAPDGTTTVELKKASTVPGSWLPEPDFAEIALAKPFQMEPREFAVMPAVIRRSVPMWELSSEAVAFLRSVRTPVQVAAKRSSRLVADLMLDPGSHRTDLPVTILGRLLTTMQRLVDVLGAPSAAKGPVKSTVRQWTQLDAVAVFPSSFGLRIESHQGSIDDNTEGHAAFQTLVDLLNAGSNEESLAPILATIGQRAKLQYRAFANALGDADVDLALNIGIPSRDEPLGGAITRDELRKLSSLLDAQGEEIEELQEVRGRLVAISLRTKFFLLEHDGTSISGRIEDACLPKMSGKKIDELYTVTIRVVTRIDETTAEPIVKNRLADIQDGESISD